MIIYFETRSQARNFAKTSQNKRSLDKKAVNNEWPVLITI